MSERMSLPQTWTLTPLSQISRIVTGRTPPTANRALYGTDIPFVSPSDLGSEKWITRAEKMLSFEGWSAVNQLPANSILFSCIGYIGKIGIAAVDLATNQQINAVIPSRQADFEFLYYALSHSSAELRSQASEQVLPIVNKSTFSKFCVPLPPLPEQQAIAAALSDADGVVAGLERVIAKKRLIKQGAMQDLLTARRRLPGFSGEWEVKKLAQLGDVKTGLTYKPENVKPFGTLVLRSSNIQNDRLAFDSNVFVDVDVSDEATVKTGDLLICVRNGSRQLIGKTAMIDSRADGMAFGAFMSAFRSEINDYLLWCFQSSLVQDQIAENLGATINQITNKTMKGIEIPLPKDETERRAITAVLSDMDAEIQTLESRLAKARAVKEGMMQNLLTGRVRLV